ncbi:MAG: ATP-binding protein [Opitutales bacterium]|nr:ATP-binding protein [Opitutales bacterium]
MKNLYNAEIRELPRLSKDVEDFCAQNSLGGNLAFALNLVLEEIFANVCLHGYEKKGGVVEIEIAKAPKKITLKISDFAKAFNPLKQAPKPDLDANIEDREIGGLGVHFIKTFMDEASYERIGGKNILTLSKNIA